MLQKEELVTVESLIERFGLSVCCAGESLNTEVTGGYSSDLLSDVIANSNAGNVWVTMQVHVNIVAVAVLKELAAIILINGRKPAEDTLRKAVDEKVTVLTSPLPAFETIGKLYESGIGKPP
jgi:hypothetical protein